MYIGNIYTDPCSFSVYYNNMGYKPCWYDTASCKLCLHLIMNSSIPNWRFSSECSVSAGGDWLPTTVDHSPGAWSARNHDRRFVSCIWLSKILANDITYVTSSVITCLTRVIIVCWSKLTVSYQIHVVSFTLAFKLYHKSIPKIWNQSSLWWKTIKAAYHCYQ